MEAQAACAFRFLRQPSRPNPARPVANSGKAAGSGTVLTAVGPVTLTVHEPVLSENMSSLTPSSSSLAPAGTVTVPLSPIAKGVPIICFLAVLGISRRADEFDQLRVRPTYLRIIDRAF